MNKKSNILILSLLVTIGLFIYLTVHHYSLKMGLGGNSLCAINSAVNCDAAATSSFAEIAGIPVALLGAVFHLILFCFVGLYRIGLIEASAHLKKTVQTMLALSALVSVIMGAISLVVIKVACPFCIATYVFSFINLWLGWNIVDEGSDRFDFRAYFNQYKSYLIALACVPFLSWAINGMILDNYGLSEVRKRVPEKLAAWNSAPTHEFDPSVGLTKQAENPRITLVEFADFKCPHCKTASQTIDVFLKGKHDIQFTYKPYPLDGTCNDSISQRGDGSRCQLAALTLCAEKIAGKGWDTHHWIFERQSQLMNVSDAFTILPELQAEFALDPEQMQTCALSTEIHETIRRSAQEGALAQVEGTPTIYMNGRKLPWGQFLEVLKAAASQ